MYNFLSDAKDSLNEAVKYYLAGKVDSDHVIYNYKFSILLLGHCAEQLMKEKLISIHPALILDKLEDFGCVDAYTAGFDDTLKRMESIGQCDISYHKEALSNLKKERNTIQHSTLTANEYRLEKTIIESIYAVVFLLEAVQSEQCHNYSEHFDELLRGQLCNYIDIYTRKRAALKSLYNSRAKVSFPYNKDHRPIPVPCPNCTELFLVYSNNNGEQTEAMECLFCHKHYASKQELTEEDRDLIISSYLAGKVGARKSLIHEIWKCPSCHRKSLIVRADDEESCICGGCGFNVNRNDLSEAMDHGGMTLSDYQAECDDALENSAKH